MKLIKTIQNLVEEAEREFPVVTGIGLKLLTVTPASPTILV